MINYCYDLSYYSLSWQDSLTVIPDALVEHTVKQAAVYDKFQFERIGFFSVDPDSSKQRVRWYFLSRPYIVLHHGLVRLMHAYDISKYRTLYALHAYELSKHSLYMESKPPSGMAPKACP